MLNKQKIMGILIGAMVVLAGCSTNSNNEETSNISEPNSAINSSEGASEQEELVATPQVALTEENIVIERAKELLLRSYDVYFTFLDMDTEFYDNEAPFIQIGELNYKPVTKFSTIQELKDYGSEVFSTAFAEDSMYFVFSEEIPVFVEKEGKLYITSDIGGMGWPFMPLVDTMELIEITEDKAVVACFASVMGDELEKYKFTLVQENGNWVLDDLYEEDMKLTDFTLIPLTEDKIDDELLFYTDLITYMSISNVRHLDWDGMVLTYMNAFTEKETKDSWYNEENQRWEIPREEIEKVFMHFSQENLPHSIDYMLYQSNEESQSDGWLGEYYITHKAFAGSGGVRNMKPVSAVEKDNILTIVFGNYHPEDYANNIVNNVIVLKVDATKNTENFVVIEYIPAII